MIRAIPANVVGVAGGEAADAQRLRDEGMPYPLLLDPDDAVRQAIGEATRLRAWRLLHPKSVAAYLRSLGARRSFRMTRSHARRRPGLVVLDAQLNVTWTHVGRTLGDYPPLDVVLTELRRAA